MSSSATETPAPQPILRISTLDETLPRQGSLSVTALVSILLHLAGLAALVLVPRMMPADLPEPASGVRAFLVEPATIAAPAPPPPPAPAAATKPPAPRPSTPARFVAPVEIPENVVADVGLDLGVEGAPGGAEGGVEGGVVGGIIGGLPAPPASPIAPVRVGVQIREPRKLKDVVPEYPEVAVQARVRGVVILEALIGPDGRVRDVTVLRGVPMLQEAAVKAVRQWVYTPTLLDGVPVPVIMTITLNFHLTS